MTFHDISNAGITVFVILGFGLFIGAVGTARRGTYLRSVILGLVGGLFFLGGNALRDHLARERERAARVEFADAISRCRGSVDFDRPSSPPPQLHQRRLIVCDERGDLKISPFFDAPYAATTAKDLSVIAFVKTENEEAGFYSGGGAGNFQSGKAYKNRMNVCLINVSDLSLIGILKLTAAPPNSVAASKNSKGSVSASGEPENWRYLHEWLLRVTGTGTGQ